MNIREELAEAATETVRKELAELAKNRDLRRIMMASDLSALITMSGTAMVGEDGRLTFGHADHDRLWRKWLFGSSTTNAVPADRILSEEISDQLREFSER